MIIYKSKAIGQSHREFYLVGLENSKMALTSTVMVGGRGKWQEEGEDGKEEREQGLEEGEGRKKGNREGGEKRKLLRTRIANRESLRKERRGTWTGRGPRGPVKGNEGGRGRGLPPLSNPSYLTHLYSTGRYVLY